MKFSNARGVLLLALFVGCAGNSAQKNANPPPQSYPPQYGQQYPQQPYPQQQPFPQQQPPYAPQQQQFPQQQQPQFPQQPPPQQPQQPQQPPPQQGRALLFPLNGPAAWQAEVRTILAELISNLSPQNQAKVRGIPLVIDPDPNEVNAFAGCDEQGAPFLAGTEGLLEAVDAIAQTRATDELFGTQTYEAYSNVTMPRLLQPKGSPALTPGIIPPQFLNNPQRLSHAHEIFDDIIAFTFGHELGHHYLNHTGCANGQAMNGGPNLAVLNQIATRIAPGLNQANEWAADNAGCINTLDTGAARRPNYRWSEKGGLQLMDFFARLERAAGISVFNPIGFLRTHPNPQLRIPPVQFAARTWYFQHPAVNPNAT